MSLLPDLGRLALCPTSGTNDSEAGPSQPPAGPNQRYALGQADVLRALILSMAGYNDDPEEACRAATPQSPEAGGRAQAGPASEPVGEGARAHRGQEGNGYGQGAPPREAWQEASVI